LAGLVVFAVASDGAAAIAAMANNNVSFLMLIPPVLFLWICRIGPSLDRNTAA
jgi:hypothetical protein